LASPPIRIFIGWLTPPSKKEIVMPKQADKLIRKLQLLCKDKELMVVFAALENVMEGVLEQAPDDEFRNHLAMRLMFMLMSLPVFGDVKQPSLGQDLTAVAAISDADLRNAAALGMIKAIASTSTPLTVDDQDPARLTLLRRPYAPVKADAAKFVYRIYEHATGVANLVQCLPGADLQIPVVLMYIQALIAMHQFDDIETTKLKAILRLVADIPDEEFREEASLQRIQDFLEAYPSERSPASTQK
jgi:hypothetical protein